MNGGKSNHFVKATYNKAKLAKMAFFGAKLQSEMIIPEINDPRSTIELFHAGNRCKKNTTTIQYMILERNKEMATLQRLL